MRRYNSLLTVIVIEAFPWALLGTILDVYGAEAYEVEFSREDGSTIAWFAVKQDEVKPYIQSKRTASPMVSAGRSDS